MTNAEAAADILNRCGQGVSAALDESNYRERKTVIIRALDLADEGKRDEAVQLIKPLSERVRAEVEALIYKKGAKK